MIQLNCTKDINMNIDNAAKTKSFLVPILSLVLISIITIATINTYLSISMFTKHLKDDIKHSKTKYLIENKKLIYNKVQIVNNAISFRISQIELQLKKSLKDRILTSLEIASFIYNKNKNKLSKEEIRGKIANQLSAIRFNENRGYYYTYGFDNNKIYGHAIKSFIGKDMTNFKDLKGQNLVNLNTKELSKNKIAFTKIYFKKPNEQNKQYPKITVITKFEPLNLVIGTGEYLDVVENRVKDYVLKRFSIKDKTSNSYVFIYDLHNINGGKNFATMILNPNRPDLIGKRINDNYKDAQGKMFRKVMLNKLKKSNEVYVKYWYKKPSINKIKPKMSYFYLNDHWKWIIGSGFYFDDLDKQIKLMENSISIYTNQIIKKTILWIGTFAFFVIIIAIFVSIRIDKTIQNYTDRMLVLKDNEQKQENIMQEQSKMVQMGEMIGNIAHQWRQPLNAISTAASGVMLSKEYHNLSDEEEIKMLDAIVNHTQYLSKTIDTFRDYIKEKKELKDVILQDRITSSIEIVRASIANNFIKIINNIDKTKPIKYTMIVGELSQVIINILNNARDVLVENKIDKPFIKIDLLQKDTTVVIILEDNGGGIPNDILPQIFDPYFTTKYKSQGTGLGLHMSKNIIEEHLKGSLEAVNTNNGVKFIITLPLQKQLDGDLDKD